MHEDLESEMLLMLKSEFNMFLSAENVLKNYTHMGKGYCPSGYYKGWTDDADHAIMDVEKCAIHCNQEPECLYFAVNPLFTCSRYNSDAGYCQHHLSICSTCPSTGNQEHELYRKIRMYTKHLIHCHAKTLKQ